MESFLRDAKPWLKLEVVPITDVYGPTAWDKELEGLVVSHETAKGGEMIMEERKRRVCGTLRSTCIIPRTLNFMMISLYSNSLE